MVLFLSTGKDLVPKPPRQSETRSRGGDRENENGAVFPPPPPYVPPSVAAILPPPPPHDDGGPPHADGLAPTADHGPTTCNGELAVAFAKW